ncbi:hypothetical protein [Streptococcus sp. S784/96/1]|uniref:hypothetical protein n=1 Tax=Streptococcus sp. S784/96/1 TaxID=2653499 RepID=UPI00138672A8|nr:hypothetical protein [Streptococcus sp. S784/96/1]
MDKPTHIIIFESMAKHIRFLEDELYNRAYKDIERLEVENERLKGRCLDFWLEIANYVNNDMCRSAIARAKAENRRPHRRWRAKQ